MVKKKYKDGLAFLTPLVNDKELDASLRSLVISYKAYGEFSEGGVVEALKDYKELIRQDKLSEGDNYNL